MSEQREEIRRIVAGGGEPMSAAAIFEKSLLIDEKQTLAEMLCEMAKRGEITKHPAPLGTGQGARFVYGPVATEPGTGTPDDVPKRSNGARKSATPKVSAREAEVIEKRMRDIQRSTDEARRIAGLGAPTTARQPRWALTSDGAFLLLGSPVEIPRAAARALFEFVRALDQGDA